MYANDITLQTMPMILKRFENNVTEMLAKAAEWMKNNKLTLHLREIKAQLIGSYRCVTKKH